MGKRKKLLAGLGGIFAAVIIAAYFIKLSGAAVLNPAGFIAQKQFDLLVFSTALMLVIIVPVFVMTAVIAWKYRENNPKKTKYQPDWDHSKLYESIWWGFPLIIVTVLSVIAWQSSHQLDPVKALASDQRPLTVQAVALQWRWLFIYPEQKVATIGFVELPKDRPVRFQLTSDAPMNAFWIPRLGGQMYAMSGMATEINLEASEIGTFGGRSSNISGEGFANMTFDARVSSAADFAAWASQTMQSSDSLGMEEYKAIARPSKDKQVAYYKLADELLFKKIIAQYHPPGATLQDIESYGH